jgi:ATP-dependent protease ClpP protease subunit
MNNDIDHQEYEVDLTDQELITILKQNTEDDQEVISDMIDQIRFLKQDLAAANNLIANLKEDLDINIQNLKADAERIKGTLI